MRERNDRLSNLLRSGFNLEEVVDPTRDDADSRGSVSISAEPFVDVLAMAEKQKDDLSACFGGMDSINESMCVVHPVAPQPLVPL